MSTMPFQVSFRVVGLYCYFENLQLPTVGPTSTVRAVMDAIVAKNLGFGYKAPGDYVDTMTYDFTSGSTTPYNSTKPVAPGMRALSDNLGSPSLIWQYYRSVTGSIDGTVCEIKLISTAQESFTTRAMNAYDPYFGAVPANFQISTYNLTWRLVQIQMTPARQQAFMQAKLAAMQSAPDAAKH
jgi:hypothetical protein